MEFVHQLVLLFPSELITFRNTFEHLLIFLHHTILLALTENIFNFSEIPLNVFLMHDALAISKFVIPVENSSRYRSALFRRTICWSRLRTLWIFLVPNQSRQSENKRTELRDSYFYFVRVIVVEKAKNTKTRTRIALMNSQIFCYDLRALNGCGDKRVFHTCKTILIFGSNKLENKRKKREKRIRFPWTFILCSLRWLSRRSFLPFFFFQRMLNEMWKKRLCLNFVRTAVFFLHNIGYFNWDARIFFRL